jgi:hypothetical protein
MDWRFCPHCETQLDDATGICPACRWDSLDAPPPARPREPEPTLMERYRGTEFDSTLAEVAGPPVIYRQTRADKVRNLILAGVIGLITLFGGMLAWSTYQGNATAAPRGGQAAPR